MAAPWQRTTAFALALLWLAGCSTPTQPQAPPAGAAGETGQPAQAAAMNGCVAESGDPPVGMVNRAYVHQAFCPAYIHTDPARVTFRLPAHLPESTARQALTLTGIDPQQVQVAFNRTRQETVLAVMLPEGRAGDQVTVGLAGPVGMGGAAVEMGFQLTRVETPRIATEFQVGNEPWRPLEPGATLPRQPLRFRFTLTGQPRGDRVEAAIQEALRQKGALTPYTTAWEGESRLVVTIPEPPPSIFFPFDWLEAGHGLQVQRSSIALYTGEGPPRLVALDPTTGQERVVGELPVDVLQASLSPDGGWAVLFAATPNAVDQEQVWVVNTRTGQRWLTGFDSGWTPRTVHWLPDGRMLLPTYRAVQVWHLAAAEGERYESAATHWGPLSPDSHYLAGTAIDPLKADAATQVTPGSVVLLDTQRMAFTLLPDIARTRLRPGSNPTNLPMVWNGPHLLVQDLVHHDGEPPAEAARWLTIDPSASEVLDETGSPPPESPPVLWPAAASGWQYRPDPTWGEIRLRSPEGREQTAGQGLAVGWRADGKLLLIRWDNFPYRRHHESR